MSSVAVPSCAPQPWGRGEHAPRWHHHLAVCALVLLGLAVTAYNNRPRGNALLDRGCGAAEASAAAAADAHCAPLEAVPRGCLLLRQACVDQRAVVLHGARYQPTDAGPPLCRVPGWRPRLAAIYPWATAGDGNPDHLPVSDPDWPSPPPVTLRAATGLETDVPPGEGGWSCTVPVVFSTVYPFNFGHILANAASWLFERLVASGGDADDPRSLAARVLVAVDTPWGLALPPWARDMLQPSARQPLTTFAE